MTIEIRSAQGTRKILQLDTIDTRSDSDLMITIIDPFMGGVPIAIRTADLTAALGLVTREDFDRLLEAREKANAALRAELDEAKATIARVRELDWRDNYTADYVQNKIAAALDPEPAFVLPTEVPATIEAKRIHFGWTSRLVLWTDGTERFWRAEYDGQDYTEAGVMDGMFTDHRLIGAES